MRECQALVGPFTAGFRWFVSLEQMQWEDEAHRDDKLAMLDFVESKFVQWFLFMTKWGSSEYFAR